ncbi:hypothetical protein HPB50_011522 [Hyalomma asiaticum]|uniref:Uncharacterized protein n=1 Tax=Hyalomma asiaticum TaxID=266040 RepID=A0ACB7T9C9_HYAAI|nr:hypothetical protein HPB50_011522 [Hyalomma asiaticum]
MYNHKGRPSKLWEEADPNWSPTLLLGYSSKHGDPARHDRSVRWQFQKEAAQAKHRADAAATESTIRDSPGVVAASLVSSLPVEDEVGIEDGETAPNKLELLVFSPRSNTHLAGKRSTKEHLLLMWSKPASSDFTFNQVEVLDTPPPYFDARWSRSSPCSDA